MSNEELTIAEKTLEKNSSDTENEDSVLPTCGDDEYSVVYKRPQTLLDVNMHYCPGCAHSLVHKLIMEVV